MPYEFAEHPYEPEPQPAPSRSGRPPRKGTGIGVLDPPPGGSSSELAQPSLRFPLWFAIVVVIGTVVLLLALSGRL